MKLIAKKIYSMGIFYVALLAYKVGYFKGSSIIQNFVANWIPVKSIVALHPLGFYWQISDRYSLTTYISSCETFTSKNLLKVLSSLDSLIVVGANLGWYPLLAKAHNPLISIDAFECNSEIFNRLSQNIKYNCFFDIKLHNIAVSSYEGFQDLYMPFNGNQGMATLNLRDFEVGGSTYLEKVRCTRLDKFYESRDSDLGNFMILLDIEGHEFYALKGAEKLIRKYHPLILLEINPSMLDAAGSSFASLRSYLESFGYLGYWLDERENLELITENVAPHIGLLGQFHGANYLFSNRPEHIRH